MLANIKRTLEPRARPMWREAVGLRRGAVLAAFTLVSLFFLAEPTGVGPAIVAMTGRPALLLLAAVVALLAIDGLLEPVHTRHDHRED